MINPYSNSTFFSFFSVLIQRFLSFLYGSISLNDLFTDEIQIIVLAGVAASSALVGSFLVLKKMTMLANSLSHTILLGIVLTFVFTRQGLGSDGQYQALDVQAMLIASVIMGVLTGFLTEFLTKTVRLQEDASTGVVFTTLFALGIILVTLLTRNAHVGTEVVMGNVDALQKDDIKLVFYVLLINVFLIVLFFKEYKISTFDPYLANSFGISTLFFNYLLMVQTSATTIGAFRAVGVLMVLSFIVGPVLTARLLVNDLKKLLFFSVCFGALSSVVGVALTRHILTVYQTPLSTSGVVVCLIVLFFIIAAFYAKKDSIFKKHAKIKVDLKN